MNCLVKPWGEVLNYKAIFDFEADEKKPAGEHEIALQNEGFWGKHTCYFYISHGSCFCISQG